MKKLNGEVLRYKRPNKLRHFFMPKNRKKGMRTINGHGSKFPAKRSGIVINNYFNCQGGVKECSCNYINTNKDWNKCGYIGSNLKVNVDRLIYKDFIILSKTKI